MQMSIVDAREMERDEDEQKHRKYNWKDGKDM